MVIILDNARYNHAKALMEWREENKKIFQLDFLPPYNLDLNHIERVWKMLRRFATHNQYFDSVDSLRNEVFNELYEWTSPNETVSQLCAIK